MQHRFEADSLVRKRTKLSWKWLLLRTTDWVTSDENCWAVEALMMNDQQLSLVETAGPQLEAFIQFCFKNWSCLTSGCDAYSENLPLCRCISWWTSVVSFWNDTMLLQRILVYELGLEMRRGFTTAVQNEWGIQARRIAPTHHRRKIGNATVYRQISKNEATEKLIFGLPP